MRTRGVNGLGMAYMAVYQYDAAGKIVEFRDFAVATSTTDWQQFSYDFTPQPRVARLRIPLGLFQPAARLRRRHPLGNVTAINYRPMNTATGKPADGLREFAAAQIGVFDASFPLKRARSIRTAAGQSVVSRAVELHGDFQGWAASGVIGYDNARWIPLLAAYDRFGRPRGAAGADVRELPRLLQRLLLGLFRRRECRSVPQSEVGHGAGMQNVARFLVRKTFLRNLKTDHRLYRRGEPVAVSVTVENRGSRPRGELVVTLRPINARNRRRSGRASRS